MVTATAGAKRQGIGASSFIRHSCFAAYKPRKTRVVAPLFTRLRHCLHVARSLTFRVLLPRKRLQTRALRRKIDKLCYPRFQQTRARREEDEKERIRNNEPKIDMRSIELPIYEQTQRNEIKDDRRRDQAITKPHAGETFPATVIFGNGLKRDAPPEIYNAGPSPLRSKKPGDSDCRRNGRDSANARVPESRLRGCV